MRPFRTMARWLRFWLAEFGIDLKRLILSLLDGPRVWRQYRQWQAQNRRSPHPWVSQFAGVNALDRREGGGTAAGHYFHQDLWTARRIFERSPRRHIDVGSRLDGFVAHVASFRPVDVLDIRPQAAVIAGMTFHQCDLMDLPPQWEACCDSLSCLHALEHFGLGRYGDPLDAEGWRTGLLNLGRMLQPGGRLYLSVPVGRQRVAFNSHRVFAVETITAAAAEGGLAWVDFAYVDDGGDLHAGVPLAEAPDCDALEYGCGIFEFSKV